MAEKKDKAYLFFWIVGWMMFSLVLLFVSFVLVAYGYWEFALPIFSLLLLVVSLPLIVYAGANYNMWFTFVKEGTIKTIVAGENFVKFLVNVNGFRYDPDTHKIVPGEDKGDDWFRRTTGLYLVSWTYPLEKVFTFDILVKKLKNNQGKGDKMEDKVLVYPKKGVDHLLWKVVRSFHLKDVDLADGTRVNLIGTGIYTSEDPYRMLFELDAKFFDFLDPLVSAYMIDTLKSVGINRLRGQDQDGKPIDNAEDVIGPNGLIGPYDVREIVGLKPISLVIEEWSIVEEDIEVQKAIQKVRIAQENAKARGIDATAESNYRKEVKKGDAEGDKEILKAFLEAKEMPHHVANILSSREMKELKGTFVQGGGTPTTLAITPAQQAPIKTETEKQEKKGDKK